MHLTALMLTAALSAQSGAPQPTAQPKSEMHQGAMFLLGAGTLGLLGSLFVVEDIESANRVGAVSLGFVAIGGLLALIDTARQHKKAAQARFRLSPLAGRVVF